MSEFKFACPVCGQHITADSSTSGQPIECPTCFRKIIVPQAPAVPDTKLILSATQVGEARPPQSDATADLGPLRRRPPRSALPAVAVWLLLLCAAGAAVLVFLGRSSSTDQTQSKKPAPGKRVPRSQYPIPTNITWTLDLTNAAFPETSAAGRIHGSGFFCEKAILQGGRLTLRQGRSGSPDLGITIYLFAQRSEELSGKLVEIRSDRTPPLPRVDLRWKDDQQHSITKTVSQGYALKVAFGETVDGRIPGQIYICLPDDARSFVAGSFDAEIKKPPPPTPHPPQPPKS